MPFTNTTIAGGSDPSRMASPARARNVPLPTRFFSLREAKESLFNLRFQASTEKLDAPSNLRKTRREIARLNTILRERELAKEQPAVATGG